MKNKPKFNIITKQEYMKVYSKIPHLEKLDVLKSIGYERAGDFTRKQRITFQEYDALCKYVEMLYSGFSVSKEPGVFCQEQFVKYYKGINSLIDSIDFKLLSPEEKNKIIEEQKRLSKQLIN